MARSLVRAGVVVITAGGGVPIIEENEHFSGQSAVIDKDLASTQLAREIDVDILAILTDVKNAYLDYGTDNAQPLSYISKHQAREHETES